MKAFFENLNFVRVITLLSLIGAGVLGYLDWKQRQHLVETRAALAVGGKIEQVSARIQENAQVFSDLADALKNDQLASSDDMETYIRKMGADPRVRIGSVKVDPRQSRGKLPKGQVDKTFLATPVPEDSTHRRESISNFLSLIESNSPRIRVTGVRIENADRRAKPHEIPGDKWTFEATVTSRQKEK